MSPTISIDTTLAGSFPRVSGDEPTSPTWETMGPMFSPRERG